MCSLAEQVNSLFTYDGDTFQQAITRDNQGKYLAYIYRERLRGKAAFAL